jgi:hypothetical protein
VLIDADADGAQWTHVHVSQIAWHLGALDGLLLSVADDVTRADIAAANFEWVYHPYDGGADVVSTSTSTVSALRSDYRDWLSPHDHGLWRSEKCSSCCTFSVASLGQQLVD